MLNGTIQDILRSNPYPVSKKDFKARRVGGSIMYHDAEILYAFVRSLVPLDILELGAFVGISTNVLIQAVRDNGQGRIVSLDKFGPGERFKFGSESNTAIGWVGRHRSELVSDSNLDIVTMVTGDVVEYCKTLPDHSFDFIFEDTDHARRTVSALIPEFRRILRPDGIALFHNIDLRAVGYGFRDAGVTDKVTGFRIPYGSSIGMLKGSDLC